MSITSNNFRSLLQRTEFRRRWASLKKSLEGVSWFFVGTVFIFSLGVIFFILGVIFLAPSHSEDETVGVIFLVIGIVGVLLGVVTFLIRCFCPRPSRITRSNRSQVHHRHRGQRVPATNNRGSNNTSSNNSNDERRNSQQQRVWSIMPPLSASTPIDSSFNNNNRSIERALSQAPPSYAEAVNGSAGRSSISIADENPPPYH